MTAFDEQMADRLRKQKRYKEAFPLLEAAANA